MRIPPIFAVLTFFVLACHAPLSARAAEAYVVDPTHTSIVFSVGHSGLSYTYGFFREASGRYVLDDANPANCRFQLVIEANSIDTNNAKRDDHLRSNTFFNVQQFRTIKFESTACSLSNTPDRGVEYLVTGNLTMHGVTREVRVPLRMLGKGPGPYGDQRTGFLCQLELKRSDFDMTNLLEKNLVGDAVSITISLEGTLQDPAGAQARPR
jgi:polyisoprenoid-binding protein YceI